VNAKRWEEIQASFDEIVELKASERPRLKEGAVAPFIDPAGYKKYITEREEAFRAELAKQKAALQY
jgi:hypothetical protein